MKIRVKTYPKWQSSIRQKMREEFKLAMLRKKIKEQRNAK